MITRVENGATIEVASRITVKCEDEKALRAIAVQFEHSNPQFYKNERFGRWKNTEERIITTWTGDLRDGVISVPRGGMQRVRDVLQAHGHTYKVRDARVTGERLGPIPEHRLTLYPYQEELVQAALKREQGILRAPTGCLDGSMMIGINRAKNGRKVRLDHLVYKFNGGISDGSQWDLDIPTYVRSPFPDGTVRLAKLTAAVESGVRDVYRVRLENTQELIATDDHRVLTPMGWRAVGDLEIGSSVFVDGEMLSGRNVLIPSRVKSVKYMRRRLTYDLTVEEVSAFMANGIAVHNSGKTVVGFALASRLQLPTLVIVWSSSLLEQWVERAGQELGISDVGIIQGSKTKIRPLTIAMQQSLARRGVEKLSDKFGLVICDEVQRFAAGTFFKSVDPFSARYRFGISDDERRKDSKEFLIHDLFGDVAASITREEVVASKHVLDVEVRVMPTDFRADWYGFSDDSLDLPFDKGVKSEKELNFNRLLQEMTTDVARNNLIKQIAVHEVKSGEQVLVMSHRREHCSELRVQFSSEHQIASGMMLGGADYKVDFRDSKSRIKSGELRIGIGTLQAIGQGLDLPKVAVGVVATPIAGNKQLTSQVRGRVCRIAAGKSSARLYVLWDKYVYPKHVDNLCKWNARVVVWDGARWMNGAEWIERNRISKEIFSFR